MTTGPSVWRRPALWAWLTLGFSLAAHLLVDIAVMLADNAPLIMDRGEYFTRALGFLQVFARPAQTEAQGLSMIAQWWEGILKATFFRPPLPGLIAALSMTIFGPSPDAAAGVGLVALVLVSVSTFLVGKRLAGYRAGLMAALVTMAMPIVMGHSRMLMMDLFLCGMVTASAGLLWWAADHGPQQRARWAGRWALVGLAWGLGLLTKITFPFFVCWSVLLEWIRPGGASRKANLAGAGLATAVAVVVSGPYYLLVMGRMYDFYTVTSQRFLEQEGGNPFSQELLRRHFFYLWENQTGPLLALLGAAALAVLLANRPAGTARLLVAFVTPWLAWACVLLRSARNTLPVLPFLALGLVLAISTLRPARLSRTVMGALGLLAVVQFGLFQFHPRAQQFLVQLMPLEDPNAEVEQLLDYGILRPFEGPTWLDRVAAKITPAGAGPLTVIYSWSDISLAVELASSAGLDGKQLHLEMLPDGIGRREEAEVIERIGRATFVLSQHIRENYFSYPQGGGTDAKRLFLKLARGDRPLLTQAVSLEMPDGAILRLMRVKATAD